MSYIFLYVSWHGRNQQHRFSSISANNAVKIVLKDWILKDNLKPFVQIVSWFAGYDFDWNCEWDAIYYGIQHTDVERDIWFDYSLIGSQPVEFWLADDPGSSVLFIKVKSLEVIETKIAAVVEVVQYYHLLKYRHVSMGIYPT